MNLEVVKEKAKTVLKITESNDIKALCEVVIKLVDELEKEGKELGFKSK